ncbi:MAG: hypothetical protein AAB391_02845 [Patescibacteria group bacterium]
MSKTYFGFGIAPSMFPDFCNICKRQLTLEQVRGMLAAGVVSCLNPSHTATIAVMESRFGLKVEIPAKAPTVSLEGGDDLIVLAVSGLPRLEGRHEYTQAEIDGAKFSFALFSVTV